MQSLSRVPTSRVGGWTNPQRRHPPQAEDEQQEGEQREEQQTLRRVRHGQGELRELRAPAVQRHRDVAEVAAAEGEGVVLAADGDPTSQ
jgi:hypothetical protein